MTELFVYWLLGDRLPTPPTTKQDPPKSCASNVSPIYNSMLPNATSPSLHLSHPTDRENISIWSLTSSAWRDALTPPLYLKESSYLMTVPLARDGGMTQWILVDRNLPPDQRHLLASCETYRKRSWISNTDGDVIEVTTHAIASVYCNPEYQGRGYASRLMKELAKVLPSWQTETTTCVASVLFSDIGKSFYAKLGWHPFRSHHIEFNSCAMDSESLSTAPLLAEDLSQLCQEDEVLSRQAMSDPWDRKMRFMIVPDHDHMLWHHSKEEFACEELFAQRPQVKGVLIGQSGSRIWAIWTHRFYGSPEKETSGNTLYILRLVIENQNALHSLSSQTRGLPCDERQCNLQVEQLKAVIQAAQAEAAEWNLHHVTLWGPSSEMQDMIERTGIPHFKEERQDEGICSLCWYGEGSGKEDSLEWIGKEKYGWC